MVDDLIKVAFEAMEKAYTPYSHYNVGAALKCEDGSIYTGCNIENASYGATMCAERVAISNAIVHGNKKFIEMAIVSKDKAMPYPCGICRQVISEFNGNLLLHICNGENKVETCTLQEIFSKQFDL